MKVFVFLLVIVGCALARDVQKTCDEKPESGMCMAYFPKYYFDKESGTCKEFIYGGCGGNGNRYDTEAECLKHCQGSKQMTDEVCKLEPVAGPCDAYFPRYYFDEKSKECKEFIYGGCGGNKNNFRTKKECEEHCSSSVSKTETHGNICRLDAETGPCRARMPRVFFNYRTGLCEDFIYGGCGGNANNFVSVKECEQTCLRQLATGNICRLNKETGPCKALVPRVFFNWRSGQCEDFVYGGCGGNENNFESVQECEQRCLMLSVPRAENVCSLDAETGPCRAMMPRFYFNKNSGQCEEFIYGGCKGNGNNFRTAAECEQTCLKHLSREEEDVCSLEAESGLCRGYFPRFFFNKNTGKCEEFVYGGCGGNRNNFVVIEDCELKCLRRN